MNLERGNPKETPKYQTWFIKNDKWSYPEKATLTNHSFPEEPKKQPRGTNNDNGIFV